VVLLTAALFSVGVAASAPAPAEPVATTFTDVKESCAQYGPPGSEPACADFVGDVTMEPVNGGVRVSWAKGADDFIVWWNCANAPSGSAGYGELGNCYVIGQKVFSTYDPQTGTGGQTCVPATLAARSCTVTGLRNGVQYGFRIRSEVSGMPDRRDLIYTPFTTTTVSPCCSIPDAPSAVSVTPVGGSLDVSWAQPADWGGAAELRYRVETVPAFTTCESTALACRLDDVPRGVPFTVQVTASNAAGASAAASSEPVTVAATVPGPPLGVRATYPKPGTARVTWAAPATDGGAPVSRYTVTASPSGKTCSTDGARSCTVTGLAGGRSYAFTVRAFTSNGAGSASPPGVAGVLLNPASAPRSLKVEAAGSAARVSWQAPARSGGGRLLTYTVRVGDEVCSTRKTQCTVAGLALGRSYSVSVVAVTTGGRSLPARLTVTTQAPQGTPPTPVAPPPDKPTATIT
jgi:hypothetical protein